MQSANASANKLRSLCLLWGEFLIFYFFHDNQKTLYANK